MIDFTMDLKINHLLNSFLKSKDHSLFANRATYMGGSEEVSLTVYGKVKSIKFPLTIDCSTGKFYLLETADFTSRLSVLCFRSFLPTLILLVKQNFCKRQQFVVFRVKLPGFNSCFFISGPVHFKILRISLNFRVSYSQYSQQIILV